MRATILVGAVVFAIACRTGREPTIATAPPVPTFELDDAQRERLALGLPLQLEVVADARVIGTCTLAYDLWEQRYQVALSPTEIAHARDATVALRLCAGPDAQLRVRSRAVELAPVF